MMNKFSKRHIEILGIVLLLLAFPLLLLIIRVSQDTRSSAAAPDKLETEDGILSGLGVTKQSDSNASGGQFIQFNYFDDPTPTNVPNPTSPPSPSIPPDAVYVPDSIDSTGNTDVTLKLNSFINGTPDGSTIVFKANGEYLISNALTISGRANLTFEGNGATIRNVAIGGVKQSTFRLQTTTHDTTFRNFIIIGVHAKAGTPDSHDVAHQGQHAFALEGVKDTLIENVTIRRVFGDCVYVGQAYGDRTWSDGVVFRDSICELTGRLGVATIGGRNILVERVTFDKLATAVFGVEPNDSTGGTDNAIYRDNTIGSYGLNNIWKSYFYYASGAQGPPARNVTLSNNSVEGNISGYDGQPIGLNIIINGDRGPRENFKVINNTSSTRVQGAVMIFKNVDGVTVTGNTQPLFSGELATFERSTNIIYENNNTN